MDLKQRRKDLTEAYQKLVTRVQELEQEKTRIIQEGMRLEGKLQLLEEQEKETPNA